MLSTAVLAASEEDVTGSVNGILHVPCTYSVHGGQYHVCWGRGWCPWYGCNDEMIKTDGQNVTWRKSDRYQLLGDISEGDVSLTITGANKEDEGTYCCKVKVNGPFNDLRTEINVNMNKENPVSSSKTSNSPTNITPTRRSMYDTYYVPHITAWRTSQETRPSEQSQSTSTTINVIRGVIGTLFLITLMGIIICIYKYQNWMKRKTEM
ncbi:hepatitis A virus cellular receptor 1 homolog isoform X2 [Hyla sarda]|uniref:hepatitis A virus cellular receptor 1 homolog isoform X2 n=1 Tax=Hyla sarda TaxID=327740 RepID=UPI0024C2575D|nr:hepatitis A virus cellular receptor 1 homolog isoform X2 [Hyla sarda]